MNDIAPPRIPILMSKARGKDPLTIYQLSIIMILFVTGIVLSLVIFIWELLKNNEWRNVNKPRNENIELKENQSMRARPFYELEAHSIGIEKGKEGRQVMTIATYHK